MKTGCTSGKKNFVFTFHSVCTVFVPFKMEHFQSALIIRDLHNYKGVPYGLEFWETVLASRRFRECIPRNKINKNCVSDDLCFHSPKGESVC